MKKIFYLVFFILILLELYSCLKEDDFIFNGLYTSDWTPDIALPLVNTSLTFEDFTGLNDSVSYIIDSQGRIIVISYSSVFYKNAYAFFKFPNQVDSIKFTLTPTIIQVLNQTGSYSTVINHDLILELNSVQRLDTIQIKKGHIIFEATNSLPRSCNLNILIPAAVKNGISFNETLSITPATGGNPTFNSVRGDLAGYILDFSQLSTPNSIKVLYAITYNNNGTGTLVPGAELSLDTRLDSVDFSFASGYFGDIHFNIPLDSLKIDLFSNNSTDSFSLTNPSLKLELKNSIGVPIILSNILFQPLNQNGQVINFTINPPIPNPKIIPGASFAGQTASDVLTFNSQNSNIVSVISQQPEYVTYSADVGTNLGNPNDWNFITDTSSFSANLHVEVPLDGWAKRFSLEDTSDFNINDINNVDSAIFRLSVTNGFPIDAYIQVYFTDTNFTVKDSLLLNPQDLFIEAAQTNSGGIAIQSTHHIHDEVFVYSKLQKIAGCKKLITHLVLSSKNSPGSSVTILNTNKLDVKIGLRARLKIKTK